MSTMTAAAPVPARTRHLSVVRSEQLALPLTWDISPGVPAVPGIPRHLRVVGDPGTYDTGGLEKLEVAWVARLALGSISMKPPSTDSISPCSTPPSSLGAVYSRCCGRDGARPFAEISGTAWGAASSCTSSVSG